MPFFTYILRCSDGTLYTGSTGDLEGRLHKHNNLKSGAKYTRARRPVELVYSEECESLSAARKREVEIKKLTRKKKEELFMV
jgi:putative endonuclease